METKQILISPEEFSKLVHREASGFRHFKIKEVFSKPKEQRTELELYLLNRWAGMFGDSL